MQVREIGCGRKSGAQPYGTEKGADLGFPGGAPPPLTVLSSARARVEFRTN